MVKILVNMVTYLVIHLANRKDIEETTKKVLPINNICNIYNNTYQQLSNFKLYLEVS